MSDKKTQREKFIEKARELGCDEDEASFDRKLKRAVRKPKVPEFDDEAVRRAERNMPRNWRDD